MLNHNPQRRRTALSAAQLSRWRAALSQRGAHVRQPTESTALAIRPGHDEGAPRSVASTQPTTAWVAIPTLSVIPSAVTMAPPTLLQAPKATPPRRPETFRASGIRRSATIEDLVGALSAKFTDDETDIKIEATIVPSSDMTDNTNTALLCFKPRVPWYLEPLHKGSEDAQIDTEVGELSFDKNFFGLTQLYPTPPRRKITAE